MSEKSSEEIAAAYDSPPWWYDIRGFCILTFAYNSSLWHQLRFFGQHMGRRHLEVACGTGTLLDLTLRWRRWKGLPEASVYGIDYAESMLAGARRRFRAQSGVAVCRADASYLPYPDNLFDTVNVANALHCFSDLDRTLRSIWRVLAPGGTMAANVLVPPRTVWPLNRIASRIDRWGMRKGLLVRPYDQAEIDDRLVGAGFELVSAGVAGNCYDVVARKKA